MSASAFVCDKVLHEEDGVLSAIRIIDIIYVAERNPNLPDTMIPGIPINAMFVLKAYPHHTDSHELEVVLINTIGEKTSIGKRIMEFKGSLGPEFPGGASIAMQMHIGVNRTGTCYLCLLLDGEEITRTSFTLTKLPAATEPKV